MKNKKGFTLIELLVVVLIIGILAGIALPQYQFAVGKSKYNSIKEMTENIASSVERYYLATNTPPANLEVLDIDPLGEYKNHNDIEKARVNLSNGNRCGFNMRELNVYQQIICFTSVNGKTIGYATTVYFLQPRVRKTCFALTTDTTDIVNKICQEETGKKPIAPGCGGTCYEYHYYN